MLHHRLGTGDVNARVECELRKRTVDKLSAGVVDVQWHAMWGLCVCPHAARVVAAVVSVSVGLYLEKQRWARE